MNYEDILKLATDESIKSSEVSNEIKSIKLKLDEPGNFVYIKVYDSFVTRLSVEKRCDQLCMPCYHLGTGRLVFGRTYSDVLRYVGKR